MDRIRLPSLILCLMLIFCPICEAKKSAAKASVSPWLYKQLQTTEKLLAKQAYNKALKKLQSMLGRVKSGSFGQATVLRSMASVFALQEKYPQAVDALSRCLALQVLPEAQQQQALLNIGQLYMATGQFQKAVDILRPWLAANPKHDAKIYILLAKAYTQLKQYRKALPYIENAIKHAQKPLESWYQLNLALYYQLENYQSAARVLQQLIRYFPGKKAYWTQLAASYLQLKQYKKAVSIKKLAYKNGFLSSEKEILELVNLLLYIDLPYQAASLLQQELNKGQLKSTVKRWELLANAWTQAKEFEAAIKALQRASRQDEKGTLYLRLGRIYVEQEYWQKAEMALQKALQKGGLKKTGDALILLGMCYHELNRPQQARAAFRKAQKYAQSRKAALQWLNYIKADASAKS